MANTYRYGFRPYKYHDFQRDLEEKVVATGKQAQDDGTSFSVDHNVGDPLKLDADGYVELANGGDTVSYICMGVMQYYDGTRLQRPAPPKLPGATAWGTVWQRRSILQCLPVDKCWWRICVDDNTTATTETAYNQLIGKNAVHTCVGDSASKEARPRLDITTATTATHEFRIMLVPESQDFDATNVEVVVAANLTNLPGWAATPGVGI